MNKESYLKGLGDLLHEHYSIIKANGIESREHKCFINGYIVAAKTLNAVYQKDMNEVIQKVHFEVLGKDVEEGKKLPSINTNLPESELTIPAYLRKGITLNF